MNCFTCTKKNKVSDNNVSVVQDKKLLHLLYHKISNFHELTDIEINLIQSLPIDERIILCNLQNRCIVVLISYLMLL